MMDLPTVPPEVLEEIVRRIARVADPDKIILFGSAARGEKGPHGDLDFLVIKSDVGHRGRLKEEIYMNLFGIAQAVDVIVATPEDVERYRHAHPTVFKPAMREGKVVYERGVSGAR